MSDNSVKSVRVLRDKVKIALAIFSLVFGVLGFYFLSGQSLLVRGTALAVGSLGAIFLLGISKFASDFFLFAREAIYEAKKVVWPTRKEALQITAIVFGFVLVMAIFLWGVDKLLEFVLYNLILGWKS